jgi:hypothetical protein
VLDEMFRDVQLRDSPGTPILLPGSGFTRWLTWYAMLPGDLERIGDRIDRAEERVEWALVSVLDSLNAWGSHATV